ncbi:MAG: four helix bundle protein, partial [Terriglobia bacterium]
VAMNCEEWTKLVPDALTQDSLWKIEAYRLAVFLADIGWNDVTRLLGDKRTIGLSDQLYRSIGSISANLAEGYSRGTNRDRARFYEYGLGSAREGRDWYYKGRLVLGEAVANHRIALLTQIIRLLLKMVPQQRGYKISESKSHYLTRLGRGDQEVPTAQNLSLLLGSVPMG